MIIYLFKSAGCLALLLSFYHLILEKEKMHNFNRYYLLGSVLFSFLVPLAIITIPNTTEFLEVVQNINTPIFTNEITPILIKEEFNYTQLFISVYLLISSILLLRFGKNLFKIIQKIRLNEKIKHEKATLVLVDDVILPHTFWKTIFINKTAYKEGKIEEELFTHELTHVTQKHTLDVLLIEIAQIIFWINPLFIFLKKAIQLNHEFLADEKVINQHKNTFQYQHLLLNKAAWENEYYMASNLNYSLTKKRLLMMTTQSSHTQILLKKLMIIPLLTGFVFLFAERVEAKEKKEVIETIYEQLGSVQGNELKINYIKRDSIKFHKDWFITIDREKYFYTFDKYERIARYYMNNKLVDLDIVKEYKKKHQLFEKLKATGKHYIFKALKEQKVIDREWSDLGGMYFRMSRADKNKVPYPNNPIRPYVRLKKGDKVWYKKRNELTAEDKLLLPPRPLKPNASKEEKLKFEKAYKAWEKRIGNNIIPPPPPPEK